MDLAAQQYSIRTIAGSDPIRDGRPAERALFSSPYFLTFDSMGRLLISDPGTGRIRRITPDPERQGFDRLRLGSIETMAGVGGNAFAGDGGPATAAHLLNPGSLALGPNGEVFVLDSARVRRIDGKGIIRTYAGGGTLPDGEDVAATSALLRPWAIAADSRGNLFISEPAASRVRRVSPDGKISTFAGGGTLGAEADGGAATLARLLTPESLAVDTHDNLLICERGRNSVRKVSPQGMISTFAGNGVAGTSGDGGPAPLAQLTRPYQVAVDGPGRTLILDIGNRTVRAVDGNGMISTAAEFSPYVPFSAIAPVPRDVAEGAVLGISGRGIAVVARYSSLLLGGAFRGPDDVAATDTFFGALQSAAFDRERHLYVVDSYSIRAVDHSGVIRPFGFTGFSIGTPARPYLLSPVAIASDAEGNLWVSDTARILRFDRDSGLLNWIAGTGQSGNTGDGGPALDAWISTASHLAPDTRGGVYFPSLHMVRYVGRDGIIRTVAGTGQSGFSGDGGPANEAQLASPAGAALDDSGTLYIADRLNRRIRAVSAAGTITTVAGGGTSTRDGPALGAVIPPPTSVAAARNREIYFAAGNAIYHINGSGYLRRIAGGDLPGFSGDDGPAALARLSVPNWLGIDGDGSIYVCDAGNRRIRKLTPLPEAVR